MGLLKEGGSKSIPAPRPPRPRQEREEQRLLDRSRLKLRLIRHLPILPPRTVALHRWPYCRVMLLTYGHGVDSAERTAAILGDAGVTSLVDIRTAPGSRRNPQFARAAMEQWLPEAGIAYRWEKRLGGFRKPGAGNPDGGWRGGRVRGRAQ